MKNYSKVFNHNHLFTIGIEEEYMLCDSTTGELISKAEEILNHIPDDLKDRFSYELIKTEIEVNTKVCATVEEAINEIIFLRNYVSNIGKIENFSVGISGTHPTAKPLEQEFVSAPGYQWVANQLGYYAKRNITFATHVHVAVKDSESAICICNALRRWVAPLLALSTNSPFFEGVQTGILSSRCFQFGTFPRTNIPSTFKSYSEYEDYVNRLIDIGSIEKPRQIWWKFRPSLDFGTIEFRMFDVQRSLARTKLFAALSQALVFQAYEDFEHGSLIEDLPMEFLEDGLWKATRFGFDSKIIDPVKLDVLQMGEFIHRLVDYVKPALTHFGNLDVLKTKIEKGQSKESS
ncbi:MAG: YbdK family carboxylate-amine ligase, partial [Fidelibacterota bacterium]